MCAWCMLCVEHSIAIIVGQVLSVVVGVAGMSVVYTVSLNPCACIHLTAFLRGPDILECCDMHQC